MVTVSALTVFTLTGCGGSSDKNAGTQPKPAPAETPVPKNTNEVPVAEKPQTVDERVKEITNWYAEVQQLGLKNCKEKKRVRYDGFDKRDMPFDQVVKTCILNDTYELVRGEFSGYENGSTVSIYKKNGKIFFVFNEGGSEGWSWEKRYYCDNDENLVRVLEREADGGKELSGPNKEVKFDTKNPKIQSHIKDVLDEIQFVLGKQ